MILQGRMFFRPVYRHPAEGTNPVRTKPIRVKIAWNAMNKARCWYLSDSQAKIMMLTA